MTDQWSDRGSGVVFFPEVIAREESEARPEGSAA